MADELPVLSFATTKLFSAWMQKNHAKSPGFWMKFARKGARATTINYADALPIVLAWGWIDGQKKALDDEFWLQRFVRRGARSIWSKINRDKALALIEAGEMKPPGLAEVERAKKDGRWDKAYDGAKTASVPPDLAVALKKNPRAAAFFETLRGANRYAILFRIHGAKKAETRAARIDKFVGMLERHETIHG